MHWNKRWVTELGFMCRWCAVCWVRYVGLGLVCRVGDVMAAEVAWRVSGSSSTARLTRRRRLYRPTRHSAACRRRKEAFSFFSRITEYWMPSVLWRCWLGGRKGIRPVKTEWWGAGVVIWLEQCADLHMAQLIPLPLTPSCFSKIQIGFTFLVPAHLGGPGTRVVKRACVCACVCVCVCVCVIEYWVFTEQHVTNVHANLDLKAVALQW